MDYYFSNSGLDSNNGTTEETPFQHLSKLSDITINPGDSILMKRDDTFRLDPIVKIMAGNSSNYINIGAYGIGIAPLMLGSQSANSTSNWVDQGSNIWRNSDSAFDTDVGNIVFNGGTSYGVKRQATNEMVTQGDFWYSFTGDYVEVYSVGNPASYYSDIECVVDMTLISIVQCSYLKIGGIKMHNCNYGISGWTHTAIEITYCSFINIGGCDQNLDYTVRLGNAIEFWQSCSDVKIEDCYFDQVYDAAITTQGSAGGAGATLRNVSIRRNVVKNSEYSFEFFMNGDNVIIEDYYVENNTFIDAGGGFGHFQRWDYVNARHVMFAGIGSGGNGNVTVNDFYIRNNIMKNSTESAIRMWNSNIDLVQFDYNSFDCDIVAYIDSTNYPTLTDWQNQGMGNDANSITGDPLLEPDDTLNPLSPCIDKGLDVGQPYYGSAPDIGAYEYQPNSGPTWIGTLQVSNITQTSLTLSWEEALAGDNPIDHYEIWENDVWLFNTNNLTSNITNLTMNTTYNFKAKAVDTADAEADSNDLQVKTLADGDGYDNYLMLITPNGYDDGKLWTFKPIDSTSFVNWIRDTDSATRVNQQGLLEQLGNNEPVINYPTVNGCGQIGVRPSATNILFRTDNMADPAVWSTNGTATSVQGLVGPDGEATACTISVGNDTDKWISINTPATNAVNYEVGMYIQKLEEMGTYLRIYDNLGGSDRWVIDVDSMTIGEWNWIDRNSPYLVSVTEFNTPYGAFSFSFRRDDVAGTLASFGAAFPQMCLTTEPCIINSSTTESELRPIDFATIDLPVGTTGIIFSIGGVEQAQIPASEGAYQIPVGEYDYIKVL